MGDIVSIKKSSDDDLHEMFTKTCPEVPAFVNEKVQLAASHSLGRGAVSVYQPSFKTVCLIVAGACLLGAGLVKGVTTRWNSAVESAALYSAQSDSPESLSRVESLSQVESLNPAKLLNTDAALGAAMPATANSEQSWRRSKGAWAEYIARLERDPFYQHVVQEKLRFEARYPSSAASTGQASNGKTSTGELSR